MQTAVMQWENLVANKSNHETISLTLNNRVEKALI